MNTLLFNYGSNHPAQLKQRVGSENIKGIYPAFVEGYMRVFRGYSVNWNGSVATLIKKKGYFTYGYVAKITPKGLDRLRPYEGPKYLEQRIEVQVSLKNDDNFEPVSAIAFIRSGREKYEHKPSREYLKAVLKTINTFWEADISDIPMR